jgi:dTDP-4-amino-4,6-dideoxygalactose transaminase
MLEKLAIHGGKKAKTVPYGKSLRFTDNELKYLKKALDQNTLFYGFGEMVKRACDKMKEYTAMPYVVPCSSGSAAIHLGLIAAGIGAGDEVVVTPNTDAGSTLGIIEEGAVPIFCDCELNMQPSAATIAAQITEFTKAVIVVHLAGYPAPVKEIVDLCEPKGIKVIEDCAQSWGTKIDNKLVGTFSTAGAYSTNDFKHISSGDGGFIVLNDKELYRRVANYSDKYYDRLFDRSLYQAHHGLNYRMTELQGAVALAQLEKVDKITTCHHEIGEKLILLTEDIPGITPIKAIDGGYSTYWWLQYQLDLDAFSVGLDEIITAIQKEGIDCKSKTQYDLIEKGLFQNRIVRPWLEGEKAMYPFVQPDGRSYTYDFNKTPNHLKLMKTSLALSVSCCYTDQDVEETAHGLRKVINYFYKQ